jgi:uncharacterized protein YeaO (DUF488 family)
VIRTKSIKTKIEPRKDGLRILIARFRGHGVPTSAYDVWMPNLGPSEPLLRAMLAREVSWAEFGRRYRRELFESDASDEKNATIKNHGQKFTLRLLQELGERGPVTLLCHCAEAEPHCHRHLLQALLRKPV